MTVAQQRAKTTANLTIARSSSYAHHGGQLGSRYPILDCSPRCTVIVESHGAQPSILIDSCTVPAGTDQDSSRSINPFAFPSM
jgi:hypothetical protein